MSRYPDTVAETEEYKGYTIEIHVDYDCESPREFCDNAGTFTTAPRCESVPDYRKNKNNDAPWLDHWNQEAYKHDAEEDTSSEYAFDNLGAMLDKWQRDTGAVAIMLRSQYGGGFSETDNEERANAVLWADADTIRKEWGKADSKRKPSKAQQNKALKILQSELKEFNSWVQGDCYGYIVKGADGEEVDSCWGFVGDSDYCMAEAKSGIDWRIKAQAKEDAEYALVTEPATLYP